MTRQAFDQELYRLQDEEMSLGSMVEEALIQSVETLKKRDFVGSRRLIAGDQDINERRYAIEEATMALIAVITAGYALTVKTLGFILTTIPYMGISIYALGKRRLVVVLVFSFAATAVTFVVMQLLFGVPLPRGPIEKLFM